MENAKLNVRVTSTLVLGDSFQELQRSEVISAIQNLFMYFYFFKLFLKKKIYSYYCKMMIVNIKDFGLNSV